MATIADPETLRTLAQWLDNPNETKAVICQLGDQRYTLGMIFREVAVAIAAQAGTTVAELGQPSATDRSITTAAADAELDLKRQKTIDNHG